MLSEMFALYAERSDFFLQLLWEHLTICFTAILIAMILGGIVGILISEYEKAARPTLGVIGVLYTIPSISMLGFLIPFSGVGNATAIIALTIYALLPMVRNTHTGLSGVDDAIIEAARGMGSTDVQILYKIKLPLAMPVILAGIRNMVTMTIALGGIASFIGAGGLGVAIYRGITTNNAVMTLCGSLLIALLALVLDLLLGIVERRVANKCHAARKTSRRALVIALAALAVLLITFIARGAKTQETVHIATKPMTEQYIMGYMLKELIEQDTDLAVELSLGVGGGTNNIQPALLSGDYDMYPEYTGTGWNMVLKRGGIYSEDFFDDLISSYENDFGLTWTGMYGFNNTYAIVVRREIAEQYDLTRTSDLRPVAGALTFGANYDYFEREDGYPAFCAAYNLEFGKTMDMDIGLRYQALAEKQIDVLPVFTTDGQLSAADVVILEDDLSFFPSYLCGNVVRMETLERYPELQTVFDEITGTITDAEMSRMNDMVETDGMEPEDVALWFLREKVLLHE